jgi:hypothetical protein
MMKHINQEIELLELSYVKTGRLDVQTTTKVVRIMLNNKDCLAESRVRLNFLIRQFLLEGMYDDATHSKLEQELLVLFTDAREKCAISSSFNFFMGQIIRVAEWYFGLEDDDKVFESRLATKMQIQACESKPSNILYRWGYLFSKGELQAASALANTLLTNQENKEWLSSFGLAGEYVLETLNFSKKHSSLT